MAGYFLACAVVSCCLLLVSGQIQVYGLLGQMLHLKTDIVGQPDDILWLHNGNKVVSFNGNEEDVFGRYERRTTLDWVTAELNVTDLTFEDSGLYELQAFIKKDLVRNTFKVEVIGKVPKPNISCNSSSDTSEAQATLTCSADSSHTRSTVNYEWDSGGKVVPGSKLTISLGDERDNDIHTCRVSNRLSKEAATFTAKSCRSEGGSFPTLAIVLATLFIILLLGIGIGIYLWKKRKARFAEGKRGDVEKFSAGKTQGGQTEAEPLVNNTTTPPFNIRLGDSPAKDHNGNGDPHTDSHDETPHTGSVKQRIHAYEKISGQTSTPNTQTGSKKTKKKMKTSENSLNSPGRKPSVGQDQENLASKDEKCPESHGFDSEETNVEDPVLALDFSQNTEPDVESSLEQSEPLMDPSETPQKGLKENEKEEQTESSPTSPGRKPSFCHDEEDLSSKDKGGIDEDHHKDDPVKVPESHGSDSEETNEQGPVGELDVSENTSPNVESGPEQPGLKENEKEEKTSSPTSLGRKPSFCHDQENLSSKDKGGIDEDRHKDDPVKVPVSHGSDSEETNEQDTVGELDASQNTSPDVESGPEQPEPLMDPSDETPQKGLKENEEEQKTESSPTLPGRKPSSSESHGSDSEEANKQDPVRELDVSQNTSSDVESGPEQPESTEEKNDNEDAKSLPVILNSPQSEEKCPPVTQNSEDKGSNGTASEDEEAVHSDQDNKQASPENAEERVPVELKETAQSDDSNEKRPTALQKQDSKAETSTIEDSHLQTNKTVSGMDSDSNLVSDTEQDLYSSRQPTPIPTQN